MSTTSKTVSKRKSKESNGLACVYCRRGIKDEDRKYYSRQAGMKGYYHWDCFVEACRQANKFGAQEIESQTISDQALEPFAQADYVSDN